MNEKMSEQVAASPEVQQYQKYPLYVYSVEQVLTHPVAKQLPNGKWVPARPLSGPLLWRVKAAWLVLTGVADALMWERQ